MSYNLNPGDIAIILHPTGEDGEWDGNVHVGIAFGKEYMEEGQRAALNMALTMAVSQHIIDDYPDIQDDFDFHKANMLQEMFPEIYAEAEKQISEQEYDETVKVQGNVYTLNAWSKTEGSA